MDGYAVRAGALGLPAGTSLSVVGACPAGHRFDGIVQDGEAIRIMTGAVVPACVDAVVPVEQTAGYVEVGEAIELQGQAVAGANIRPIGSEVAVGATLLAVGTRIGPAAIGALAALGHAEVPVFVRPRVAILATGDEVVDITREPAPHQVRNSNAHALTAQVRAAGGEPVLLGIAADDDVTLRATLRDALDQADLLLTIGGVSKGTHDLVHSILAELGVGQRFHGVKLKPGKPVFFGVRLDAPARGGRLDALARHGGPGALVGVVEMARKTCVFGLPGNPASTFTVFDLLVRPWIARVSGAPAPPPPLLARVAGLPFQKNWRLQAVPASLHTDADGTLVAELGSSRSSGDPFGLVPHYAYALIPPDTEPGPELRVPVEFYADRDPCAG
jgi:molybdopterin molybdotransferase